MAASLPRPLGSRYRKVFRAFQLGSHCQPLIQGGVCGGRCSAPKCHDAQARYQPTACDNEHVSCFHPSFRNCTLSFGLCARQVAVLRVAAPWVQGTLVIIGMEHLLGSLLLLTQPHTTQSTFHAAAGVQCKKPLVWSQCGPIINDTGTSGDVVGGAWAGSLAVGTHRSHLVTTQTQILQRPRLANGKDRPSTQTLRNYFW